MHTKVSLPQECFHSVHAKLWSVKIRLFYRSFRLKLYRSGSCKYSWDSHMHCNVSHTVIIFTRAQTSLSWAKELPTSHTHVIAWQLLDTVGPVLLMRCGILWNGLPAQLQSEVNIDVSTFFLHSFIPARLNYFHFAYPGASQEVHCCSLLTQWDKFTIWISIVYSMMRWIQSTLII